MNIILLVVVILLGLGLSIMLIPSQKDVALLQLRSNNIEQARGTLNEQLAAGDSSVAVVASLAEIALHDGEIEEAVRVMETYTARRPKDYGAKRKLAEFYRFAQRQDDFVRLMAEVVAAEGRPEEWRQLVDLYRYRGEFPELRRALSGIIDKGYARPPEFLEAAELAAANGAPKEALAFLERMWRSHPTSFQVDSVKLFAMIAGTYGEEDRAAAVVARFAEAKGSRGAIAPIIREASDREQNLLGLRLLSAFEDDLYLSPPLLVFWARMQGALDRTTVALERLVALDRDGKLPDLLFPVFIDLALQGQEVDLLEQITLPRDISGLTDFRLRSVADTAVAFRRPALMQKLLKELPAPFRAAHPALMAELLLGVGRRQDAQAVLAGVVVPDLPTHEQFRLARAWLKLGAEGRAAALLDSIAARPDLHEAMVRGLAQLYISTERLQSGLAAFNGLRRNNPSDAVEAGWARLAASAGRDKALLAWLQQQVQIDRDLLTDIVSLSSPGLAPKSALHAAERLFRDHPGRESRRLFGQALTADGRPGQALDILGVLLPGSAEEAETWVEALVAANRRADALAFLVARGQDGRLAALLADDLISLAIGLGQPELAFAEVRRQDPTRLPGNTVAYVAETAALSGRFDLIDDLLAAVGPAFLDARPVTAARIAIARNDRVAAAQWLGRASALPDLRLRDQLDLARVQSALGDQAGALARLEGLSRNPEIPAWAIGNLATLYLELDRARDGLPLLRELAATRSDPQVQAGWARLETRAGDARRVQKWLQANRVTDRQLLEDIHFLAAESGAEKLAFDAADRLYKLAQDDVTRRIYANALIGRGRPEDALPILEGLLPGTPQDAEIYVAALSAVGRKPQALAYLQDRAAGAPQPLLLADDLMALAIELDQPELAFAEARRQNPTLLPEDTIASLAENAAQAGDFDLIDWLVAKVGPAFLEARPVTAARIAVARGDNKAARTWVDKALALPGLSLNDRLSVARTLTDLGENERALTLLETVARDPATPPFAIASLANLYLELGKAKEGLPLLQTLRETRDAPQVQEGWARLETKAGKEEPVLAWLNRTAQPGRQVLSDIYYLAAEGGKPKLAFASAEKLRRLYPGDDALLIWGQALTAAGRADEAVPVLRALLPGTPEVRSAYIAALGRGGDPADLRKFAETALSDPTMDATTREGLLFALLDAGLGDIALPALRDLARADPAKWEEPYLQALRLAKADKERTDLIVRRLEGNPPRARRDLLLYELLEAAGPARALPFLEKVARAEPAGPWPAVYEEALATAGRKDDLVAWLTRRSLDEQVKPVDRRNTAFRLLDLGAKSAAEQAFGLLARDARPESPDVQQLVFLWGPRPPERGLDWLSARASAAATATERAAWLQLLNDVGATDRTIAQVANRPPTDGADPILKPYADALIFQRRFDDVAALLRPLIPATDDEQALLRMADWAEQASKQDVAVDVWEKLLTRIGDDPDRLLQAGRSFTFAGRSERAVEVLDRFFQVAPPEARADHRPWYYYGLALSGMNRPQEGRAAYREMLQRIRTNSADDFESRRMQATGLNAIGAHEEAIEVYEGLVAERPTDRSLLADYVAMLIETERFDRADQLLRQN
ncbi:MAG: hypothetical protein P1U65_01645 [Minwuia sp.]|nr:hypothetical protein [Minwuia sp.]